MSESAVSMAFVSMAFREVLGGNHILFNCTITAVLVLAERPMVIDPLTFRFQLLHLNPVSHFLQCQLTLALNVDLPFHFK